MKRKAAPAKGAQKKIPAKSSPKPKSVTPAKSPAPSKAGKPKTATKSAVKSAARSAKSSAASLKKTLAATVKKAAKKIAPREKPAKAGVKTAKKSPVKTAPAKAAAKAAPKQAPAKTLRPKAFPARDAEKAFGFSAGVPELPEAYGEDRLVLMTRDPEYLHAYWEITPEQYALSEAAKRDDEEYREALRLNWVARDLFAPNFALLPVALEARKVYLRVPYSGLSYQVEIGWVSEQGHFISILGRSNRSDAPESWKQTRQRLRQAAGERSVLEYNLSVTQPLGSSELGRAGALSTEKSAALSGDWDFEGPGSLSSSASSGAAVKKIPPAAKAASRRHEAVRPNYPPKRRRR